ncbi:Fe(3+) ABC transporter substrate-binding protein [Synechococcus sp. PCC 7502]|uniref:Fe(3+) ABC transporter substrate-binding protein n=1 Tax=Synechococcus sp. PCC 7502 TaxID=1173263 RepID=UPI0035270181
MMNKISRRVLLGLLPLGAFALTTSSYFYGSQDSLAQNTTGVLNLYSARHYDTDNSIYQSFTQKTGIKINLVEADAAKLIERIKSEGANSPADVILTVDAGNLYRAQESGILQPIRSRLLETRIPANLREPSGYWFGLTKRARVIVYNKSKVNPSKLSTYEDLGSPKWRGKIIVRSSNNIYNQSLVASLVASIGAKNTETWVKGFVSNFARPPEGNDTAQIQAVASGVADLALVNTYYVIRLAKSNKPDDQEVASKIGIFFPNQNNRGTHINVSGAGVAKNAPNRLAAIKFIEHLTEYQSQQIFALSNNEYPVLRGVPIEPILGGYGQFKEDEINASELGKNNRTALQIMDRAGWR